VAELADALDSKSGTRKSVWVRPPPSAPLGILNVTQTIARKPRHPSRRGFLHTCGLTFAAATVGSRTVSSLAADVVTGAVPPPQSSGATSPARQIPLKIGIRAATMKMVGDAAVLETAARIPGIRGVELQVTAGARNLRDPGVLRQYKRDSDRWDIRIPSIAGIWDRGINVSSPEAPDNLQLAIRAAELLGSAVVLVAFFKENAPDLAREESYGPVITNLRKAAPAAADAGVLLGLENSLSPAENIKLLDLVAHPSVRVYYDLHNMATYGHGPEAVPGVKLLGRERICAVHVKNGDKLIEQPGPIDWPAAFAAFNEIGYEGWFTYETSHKTLAACLGDTARNNTFLQKNIRMPSSQ
jgi:L-ribulose-5-phosphate 3-epimerase